jgi:ferredoxin
LNVAIACYSATGNTRLACEYAAARLGRARVTLHDIAKKEMPDWTACGLVGFACFADFWAPPQLMFDYLAQVPVQNNLPAFLLCTCGFSPGRTLPILADLVSGRGFKVAAAASLHTPENHVPTIVRGNTAASSPNPRELRAFDAFASRLGSIAARIGRGEDVPTIRLRPGPVSWLIRFPRTKSRDDMGDKLVDSDLCTECGLCARGCAYGAITLSPKPVFNQSRCYGCWACYNRCPTRAIYTRKFRSVGHYPKPSPLLRTKLTP